MKKNSKERGKKKKEMERRGEKRWNFFRMVEFFLVDAKQLSSLLS